jgi:hypothetical protein
MEEIPRIVRVLIMYIIPAAVLMIGTWCLSRNRFMPTKLKGLIFAVFGFGIAYLFREDQGEGPFLRPVGVLMGIVGIYFFFEGLKKEIVSAINIKSKPEQDET